MYVRRLTLTQTADIHSQWSSIIPLWRVSSLALCSPSLASRGRHRALLFRGLWIFLSLASAHSLALLSRDARSALCRKIRQSNSSERLVRFLFALLGRFSGCGGNRAVASTEWLVFSNSRERNCCGEGILTFLFLRRSHSAGFPRNESCRFGWDKYSKRILS
ncbi:hypothetical protein NPIL_479201 [Nephila pilipes]|uniref:Uncharacterized protein n=1 Tax=Nephila pilipes TaxID=299642 RepID=A0A8X6UEB3_NEPPI|nr:hypothetical protein NPIL_479201 [Nephila pilipes]